MVSKEHEKMMDILAILPILFLPFQIHTVGVFVYFFQYFLFKIMGLRSQLVNLGLLLLDPAVEILNMRKKFLRVDGNLEKITMRDFHSKTK